MSTKTSIKRIALVAVSALGFGLMSVVPAKAAQVFVSTAITATVAAASVEVGSAASISVVAGTPNLADGDAVATIKAAMTTRPATAAGAIYNDQTADAGGCDYGADVAANAAGGIMTMTLAGGGGGAACAAQTTTFGSFKYAVAVAGSYTMTIWNDQDGNGLVSLGEESVTASFTGTAANTTPSATYSTIEAWSVTTPSQSKAAGTDLDGADEIINITVQNTADVDLNNTTIRAVVNGPGTVTLTPGGGGNAATGRDVTVTNTGDTNVATLELLADGTAGYTTVDVYAGTVLLGTTAKVLWYGTLATLSVTQAKSVVTKDTALTGALTIKGLDSDGNPVPLADNTVIGTSSDATVLVTKDGDDDAEASGVLTLQVTAANDVTTTSGRSATMTWKYLISGTTYTPEVVTTFVVGGALASVTITFDKSSYAPGELVTATITAKDASGNAAGDAQVFAAGTPTLASSMAVQGMTTSAISTVGGTASTTFYAPATSGSFTVSANATIGGVATKITSDTAIVTNAGEAAAEAASDAALEAIDAANAATDAANLAAEAADAATVAAEEARDAADAATAAVEALAAEVATMIDSLKAQLTTLAKVVAKIAKKVKA